MSTILKPVESKTKHLDFFLSQCHRRKYPSKSTIIYAGDKSDSLFYIIKGSVTVIIEDDDGREMIMAYLNTGDFFGEMGLFDNMDSRSAWVKAASRPRARSCRPGGASAWATRHPCSTTARA